MAYKCLSNPFSLYFIFLMYDVLYHMCRFELTGLPSPALVEDVAIKTSSNAAYQMMKQGGEPQDGYETVASPPRGPPPPNQRGCMRFPHLLPVVTPSLQYHPQWLQQERRRRRRRRRRECMRSFLETSDLVISYN